VPGENTVCDGGGREVGRRTGKKNNKPGKTDKALVCIHTRRLSFLPPARVVIGREQVESDLHERFGATAGLVRLRQDVAARGRDGAAMGPRWGRRGRGQWKGGKDGRRGDIPPVISFIPLHYGVIAFARAGCRAKTSAKKTEPRRDALYYLLARF
jgi:hypothetical protein